MGGEVVTRSGQAEHLSTQAQGKVAQVSRPAAAQGLDGFRNLQGVAHRATERLTHIGHVRDRLPAGLGANGDQESSQGFALRLRVDEGAASDLHVQDDGVRPRRQLLAHHAAGDERHRVHRGGGVAERVQRLVRGRNVGGLARDGDPDAAYLVDERVHRQVDPKAGNRLELVEGTPAVAEGPAGELRDGDPGGGDHGRHHQGGFVAHAAGRVLVDLRARDTGEVEHPPAVCHGHRQRMRFGFVHATQAHRHQPGSQLIVRDASGGRPAGEKFKLGGGMGETIALVADNLEGRHAYRVWRCS